MDRHFSFLIYSKRTNPYSTYIPMPILPVYRILKASVTLWVLKIWVPKPQIVSLTNFCQEGFNEVLARASVTSHQSIMVVEGYSYIFCVSGHVDDLWTAAKHSYSIWYPYTYIVEHRTLIRTLVFRFVSSIPVTFFTVILLILFIVQRFHDLSNTCKALCSNVLFARK